MPSVVAGITEEMDGLLDWLVETGREESRSEAASNLMEYAASDKYSYVLDE